MENLACVSLQNKSHTVLFAHENSMRNIFVCCQYELVETNANTNTKNCVCSMRGHTASDAC